MATRDCGPQVRPRRGRRTFLGLAVLTLLAACGGAPAEPDRLGALTLRIVGLPEAVDAAVTVTGPAGFTRALVAGATLDALAPGAYTVEADEVAGEGARYLPDPLLQAAVVEAAKDPTVVTVTYRRGTAGRGELRLAIGGLPVGQDAAVTVTGPGGFRRDVATSTTLDGLAPGAYAVTAEAVAGVYRYAPAPASSTVAVTGGAVAEAAVAYTATSGALALEVEGLPPAAAPLLELTGPDGAERIVTVAGLLKDLPPGAYRYATPDVLTAAETTTGEVGYRYENVADPSWDGAVAAGVTATLRLAYQPRTGSILVVVRGLPGGADASVAVLRQGAPVHRFLATGARNHLSPGRYAVEAEDVTADGYPFTGAATPAEPEVVAGEAVVAIAAYQATHGKLRLVSEGLPDGVAARVEVTSAATGTRTVTLPDTLLSLPGYFSLDPVDDEIEAGGDTYVLVKGPSFAEVEPGRETRLAFRYAVVGALQINVTGLPSGTAATLDLTGPDGLATVLVVRGGALLYRPAPIGRYQITARIVPPLYFPEPTNQSVTVTPGSTVEANVHYRRPVNQPGAGGER